MPGQMFAWSACFCWGVCWYSGTLSTPNPICMRAWEVGRVGQISPRMFHESQEGFTKKKTQTLNPRCSTPNRKRGGRVGGEGGGGRLQFWWFLGGRWVGGGGWGGGRGMEGACPFAPEPSLDYRCRGGLALALKFVFIYANLRV